MGLAWGLASGANPSSYEVRLGSDGAWVDVGSDVWQAGRNYLYTFTGLQPSTEYTMSVRATGNGNTGNAYTVTASTISAASDYDVRISGSCGIARLSFSGMNSPGNAPHEFQLLAASYPGQSGQALIDFYSYVTIDKVTTAITIGEVAPGERFYVNLLQVLNGTAITQRMVQIFGEELASCPLKSKREPTPTPTPIPSPTPPVYTLNQLPPGIQVQHWVEGAQGRRVGPESIGRADLIAQGMLDAVDVWGYVTPGVEVCFSQYGRLVFLDAAYAPRQLFELPAYQRAGRTCATIDRAGTIVLLRSAAPPPEATSLPPSLPLSDCQVQPWADLNFRQNPPDGDVLGVTAVREWLPASEKSAGYFKVRLHQWDSEGWISGDFVHTHGDCGV